MSLIYSGQLIRTWDGYTGTFCYWLPDGDAVVELESEWCEWDPDVLPAKYTLHSDEWELVEDEPGLHEEIYEKGLFDD